jgi:hypothetical protein
MKPISEIADPARVRAIVDDAIARGDLTMAADFAAAFPDPKDHRDAMIRINNALMKGPTMTQMAWTKQIMKLTSLNVRRELAGKNPADGRTASDLRLVVTGGNDLLDKLSPHLRGSFYQADVDKQGVLLPHALTKLIHPLLKCDALAYDLKHAGYHVVLDHAGNDESAIVLDDCEVNEFRLNLEEGGTVAISMRVQFHPDPGQLDPLADKLQQEVIVTMKPPKVPKSLQKPTPDLADQASAAAGATT